MTVNSGIGGMEAQAEALAAAVLNALPTQLAVIDDTGTIVSVNDTWRAFARGNGMSWPDFGLGANYIAVCEGAVGEGETEAAAMAEGLKAVLTGAQERFYLEYACSSPDIERYFAARVAPFRSEGRDWIVVTHEDITQQRMAESAVRDREARFRAMIENASDLITIVTHEGEIQYESPSTEKVLGYLNATRVGQSMFDTIHADDQSRVVTAISRCLDRPGRTLPLEFRVRHGDGSWRTFEGTVRNLTAEPAVAGLVMNCRDVTERKEAEEAQARLATVIDLLPSFVSVADPRGRLLYLNQSFRRFLGFDGPVERLNLTDLHPQWVNDCLLHQSLPVAIREGVWSGETALLDEEGGEVPVLQTILAHKARGGGVEFLSTILHDISERKTSEAALRQSDEVFRQIAENVNEMLWIFDLEVGRPIYISSGYERIWGRPLETAYEDPAEFLAGVSPADRQRFSHSLNERGRDDEFRIARPDGSQRWLRGRTFPIRDSRGSVVRIVGLTEDVTERRQLEADLRQAQRLEAIGHLAAGVAHEINTPVQYVSDNLLFLRDGFRDLLGVLECHQELMREADERSVVPEEVARARAVAESLDLDYLVQEVPQAVTQALEGVERVAGIVRAIKEFSHPGTSRRVPADINRAIQSTLTVARHEWKYVAELATDFDPSLPLVRVYLGEFNQAVLNLVVNAAHAIGEAVRLRPGERGVLTVQTRAVDGGVEIRVGDTGRGIPEEIRGRIYDPFFTTKEVGRGTGQGLTLAHSVIVDQHGGSLWFETEVGRGTTFIIRLPIQEASCELTPEGEQ